MVTQDQIIQAVRKVGLVSEEVVQGVIAEAAEKKKSFQDVLLSKDAVKPDEFGKLIAELYKVKFVDLRRESIPEDILLLIPEVVAAHRSAVAFKRDSEGLKIALADPTDYGFVKQMEKKTGDPIIVYYSPEPLIKQALGNYRKSIKKQFEDIIQSNVQKAHGARAEDVSIIKIVDTLLEYGYHNKSSDVHIEPHREDVIIRFRIDGILHDVLNLPASVHDLIVTRIKIQSKLRTDEHRAAQDGKMVIDIDKQEIDVRVSILPTTQGEKVVMRLLTPDSRLTSLEELGLSEHDLKIVRSSIKRPHGMILATGPTGSGKTTSLYSLLRIVNTRDVNISTIEDPVEYYLQGVNQVQVNSKTNLTFASGLRSLLRQDPDIIMVGEIRDQETASIAVNAAMTGHLVLSTLHTNDAATSLPRLYDMKIEPFLIASTINVIMAQRLVRRICTKCISSYSISVDDIHKMIGDSVDASEFIYDNSLRVYKGLGCNACSNTGYRGRLGIFEVLQMSDEIRELIVAKADSDHIRDAAVKAGMVTMIQDGLAKVAVGKTTVEELIRVVQE